MIFFIKTVIISLILELIIFIIKIKLLLKKFITNWFMKNLKITNKLSISNNQKPLLVAEISANLQVVKKFLKHILEAKNQVLILLRYKPTNQKI